MSKPYKNSDDLKRKLREIKRFELKIRSDNRDLVWNKFFSLKNSANKDVKYTFDTLSLMNKEELAAIIEEYFYHVYYWYYKERGMVDNSFIDIDILTELGLPIDSDYNDVIRTFREKVKTYHPDNGGDVGKFLAIMESYNKFKAEV
jgi:hypothetical protein